jgi:ribosome biogenesis SPOUT family RNA methylase Rps3
VCLLDPKAEHALSPEDGDRFEWFLFGVQCFIYFFPVVT